MLQYFAHMVGKRSEKILKLTSLRFEGALKDVGEKRPMTLRENFYVVPNSIPKIRFMKI